MTPKKIFSTLLIHRLELSVNLGWRNKERDKEQAVLLDMQIRFPSPPKACESDNLDDTVCYAKLIDAIREKIADVNYHLVEHLSADIYTVAQLHLPEESKLKVTITKYPKIGGLTGGVSFNYGDEI